MKLKCKCNGMPIKGHMCMNVSVGGKYCGNTKIKCEHQEQEFDLEK